MVIYLEEFIGEDASMVVKLKKSLFIDALLGFRTCLNSISFLFYKPMSLTPLQPYKVLFDPQDRQSLICGDKSQELSIWFGPFGK